MTNSTNPDPSPEYFIYLIEGSIMSIGNLILSMSIFYHIALRSEKQYLVVAFMFLADTLNGAAQLFAAIYRIYLLYSGFHYVKVSRWDCMTKLHSILWTFSEPCAALMLAVISFDRLVLVTNPTHYMSSNWLIYTAIATPYIWSTCSLLVALISAYFSPREANVEQYCLLSFGQGTTYWAYHGLLSVVGGALSIILFAIVVIKNKQRQAKVANDSASTTAQQILRKQRRFTKSLAISCCFTFIFFLIPRSIGTGLYYSSMDRAVAAYWMMILYWIIGNINAILNLFIFTIRHNEVRKGVKAMFKRKKLPADLRLWFPATVITRSTRNSHSARRISTRSAAIQISTNQRGSLVSRNDHPVEDFDNR